MLGPLGQGFQVDSRSRHLLLVAGGLGIADLRLLIDEALRDGRQVVLLYGCRDVAEVYPRRSSPTSSSTSSRPTTGRWATTGS